MLPLLLIVAGAAAPPARADGPDFAHGETLLRDVQAAFETVAAAVAPAVVSVHAERPVLPALATEATGEESEAVRRRAWMHTGSGVVVRTDGMVLTSEHVVHAARRISVTFHDGIQEPAVLVAADPRSDLAVLRVRRTGLTAAELGDADRLRLGHLVLALGNPLGMAADGRAAVSHGLVSAKGRALPPEFGIEEDRYYGDLIQTTAWINPGNSGGPLIDIRGRVIGIVTAMSTRSGANEGVGFAVPVASRTRAVIDCLLRGEEVAYGYLGVQIRTPTADECHRGGVAPGCGAVISEVPIGPAQRAGLSAGDLIRRFGDTPVESPDHLLRLIGGTPPGAEVRIEFVRDRTAHTVAARIERRRTPAPSGPPAITRAWRGALLGPVNEAVRRQGQVDAGALWVLEVIPDSPAARAGLAPGDVIVAIDETRLREPDAAWALLQRPTAAVAVRLMNGRIRQVAPQH